MLISDEAERIKESKGRVFCMKDEPGVYRVWMPNGKTPGLAISRAFGDYCMKDYGLISVPDVTHRKLTTGDQFIILATDGVCFFFYRVSVTHVKKKTIYLFKFLKYLISIWLCLRCGMLYPTKRQ